MTEVDVEFREASADRPIQRVPFAHLSIEAGHFYYGDLGNGFDYFYEHFRRIVRWLTAAREAWTDARPGTLPRVSTCVLIDDYFDDPSSPQDVVPQLRGAARKAGLEIDYLVRESGCAQPDTLAGDEAEGVSLADLVLARLVEDPPPGTTGARPPSRQTGWLCNGQRSPVTESQEAMRKPRAWLPPRENAATNHSIFTDVELWNHGGDARKWSCPMLAAVWQLLRLGMIRNDGRPPQPQPVPDDLPEEWRWLPPLVRLSKHAAPFSAYRTLSICAPIFLPVEHAVRTILERLAVDPTVLQQSVDSGENEGIAVPAAVVDRIEYLFVDTGPVRGAGPR